MSQQGVQKGVPTVVNPLKGSNQKKPGEPVLAVECSAVSAWMTSAAAGVRGGVLGGGVLGTGYWVWWVPGTGPCTGSIDPNTGLIGPIDPNTGLYWPY